MMRRLRLSPSEECPSLDDSSVSFKVVARGRHGRGMGLVVVVVLLAAASCAAGLGWRMHSGRVTWREVEETVGGEASHNVALGDTEADMETVIVDAEHGLGEPVPEDADSGVDEAQPGDAMLKQDEELAYVFSKDPSTRPHITHLFNSFAPRSQALRTEIHLVYLSWIRAAKYARGKGVVVEYLDAVLEKDRDSVPPFARSSPLTDFVRDPYNGRMLPTVGEIFETGYRQGAGDLLIYSNLDIGVREDFYIRMWEKANTRVEQTRSEQERIFSACLRMLVRCTNYTARAAMNVAELCVADVEEYRSLHGVADARLHEHFRYNLARLVLHSDVANNFSSQGLRTLFETAGGKKDEFERALADPSSFSALLLEIQDGATSSGRLLDVAFTVTRLDHTVSPKVMASLKPTLENLDRVLKESRNSTHPGNDVFAVPRRKIPEVLMRTRHPLSWRPWGFWIVHAFQWAGLKWRRYEGTVSNALTFHLGVSGRVANDWIKLRNKRPLFTLQLVADWNNVTEGNFTKLFSVPSYCDNPGLYRESAFCEPGRSLEHGHYCAGDVRFGCLKWNYLFLRDGYNYFLACNAMAKKASKVPVKDSLDMDRFIKTKYIVEPFCSFCKPVLSAYGKKKTARLIDTTCVHDLQLHSCTSNGCKYIRLKQTNTVK